MTIIDVREPIEFNNGHVEGAHNVPPSELMSGKLPKPLNNLKKGEEIIVYCVSGSRSRVAINILKQYGFTNLANGINKFQTEEYLKNLQNNQQNTTID